MAAAFRGLATIMCFDSRRAITVIPSPSGRGFQPRCSGCQSRVVTPRRSRRISPVTLRARSFASLRAERRSFAALRMTTRYRLFTTLFRLDEDPLLLNADVVSNVALNLLLPALAPHECPRGVEHAGRRRAAGRRATRPTGAASSGARIAHDVMFPLVERAGFRTTAGSSRSGRSSIIAAFGVSSLANPNDPRLVSSSCRSSRAGPRDVDSLRRDLQAGRDRRAAARRVEPACRTAAGLSRRDRKFRALMAERARRSVARCTTSRTERSTRGRLSVWPGAGRARAITLRGMCSSLYPSGHCALANALDATRAWRDARRRQCRPAARTYSYPTAEEWDEFLRRGWRVADPSDLREVASQLHARGMTVRPVAWYNHVHPQAMSLRMSALDRALGVAISFIAERPREPGRRGTARGANDCDRSAAGEPHRWTRAVRDHREHVICTDAASADIARRFAASLIPATGSVDPGSRRAAGAPPGSCSTRNARLTRLGDEGYELAVTARQVSIRARERAGVFYGLQTMRQLLPPEIFREATRRQRRVDDSGGARSSIARASPGAARTSTSAAISCRRSS